MVFCKYFQKLAFFIQIKSGICIFWKKGLGKNLDISMYTFLGKALFCLHFSLFIWIKLRKNDEDQQLRKKLNLGNSRQN